MKVAIAIIDLLDLGSGKCRESSIGIDKRFERRIKRRNRKERKGKERHSLGPGH